LNDPYHGWVDGHQDGLNLESKQRIMGKLTVNTKILPLSKFLKKYERFPKVEVVTGLLIRRQFYRKIAASSLSRLLRETFTCLSWFHHEGWHDVNPQEQFSLEKGKLKSYSLPNLYRQHF